MRLPPCAAALALACLVAATPARASYLVIAKSSVSDGTGTCTDIDDSGVLVAPSASASAACPSGTAEASVDLATASISLFAFADSNPPQTTTLSSAEAELFDVVHFQVPPAMQGQPFPLGVVFALDGVITPDAAPHVSTTILLSRCIVSDQGSVNTFDGIFIDDPDSIATTPVVGLRTISETIEITPPGYSIAVSMRMLAPGLTEGTIDFLTTGELQLAIPPGVTYTSDSGVFHAPEPGAAAIGAGALAALAFLRRR